MTRKTGSKKNGKIARFKDIYDEDFLWEDHEKSQQGIRKKNKQKDRKQSIREKW